MKPKVIIMSGYGINCEKESAYAFDLAGAESKIVHINDLISGKEKMSDYQIMMFPGGFSYGDDTGSGNAFANKLRDNLWEDLMTFVKDHKLILGVCNGFQVMSRLGLFSSNGKSYGKVINALESNDSNRYECMWVHVKNLSEKCVFTKGLSKLFIPVAHGEGRFYCSKETLDVLKNEDQLVFSFCDENGIPVNGVYPQNPNGALDDITGICDSTGLIMGMMPHPERAIFSASRPDYHLKKEEASRKGVQLEEIVEDNLKIFKNAVEYFN